MLWLALAQPVASQSDEDDHLGMIEYEIACLPCHGIDGRGDGPSADKLTTAPTDLTGIARANGGTFPTSAIERIVDGRRLIGGHQQRSMPVWGERYSRRVDELETSAASEQRAQARIRALVDYIKRLQRP